MSQPSNRPADRLGIEGSQIAGYRVERVVGEGGSGVVYRGREVGSLERPVAIKCLTGLRGTAEERPAFRSLLRREGKILTDLSRWHAAIVQAYALEETETATGQWIPCLVLEWVDGHTLREDIGRRGRRSLDDAMKLLEPVAKALDVAHRRGIAHRDLTPRNIMVTDTPAGSSTKLLDFGIAKLMSDAAKANVGVTATGPPSWRRTPAYAAPEQVTGDTTGPWTDVFALALVLVEVVAGRHPFAGSTVTDESTDEHERRLGQAIRDRASRPTLRAADIECSDAIEDVFQTALAVDPTKRFQTAGEFWDALSGAIGKPRPRWARKVVVGVVGAALLAVALTVGWLGSTEQAAPTASSSGTMRPPAPTRAQPPAPQVLSRPSGSPPRAAYYASVCDQPCCGGPSCEVTEQNSGEGGYAKCPAGEARCRSCPSAMTCIPGACSDEFAPRAQWDLRLSGVFVRADGGFASICDSQYAGAVLCFRHHGGACNRISTEDACSHDAGAITTVRVTTEDVVQQLLEIEILDRSESVVLASGRVYAPPGRKHLCTGYERGITPKNGSGISKIGFFLEPVDW